LVRNLCHLTSYISLLTNGRGHGYATEVVSAFLTWSWDAYPELWRWQASVFGWAQASMHVLRKAGFKEEGVHKAAVFKWSKLCDMHWFGLIREGLDVVTSPPY
jgi:RimJ/RimL family protein N-acetyltransferase